ncbi:hypothetical protein ABH940_002839 [Streptacidiphilus sp. BW17]|uniref:hypothetical protein n=1 Tax=Streptacidiphilus sp. BW17 TaxID=3156274 RepID=UPI003513F3D3
MAAPSARNEESAVQVWLFAPAQESPDQVRIRRVIESKARQESLAFNVRRVESIRAIGGDNPGRPFNVLKIEDARNLYMGLHRSKAVVVATTASLIRRDPSSTPVRKKQLLSLEDFVRYKAAYRLFRSPAEAERFIEPITSLAQPAMNSDVHDPRVLPLHIFDSQQEWKGLDTDAGSKKFKSTFGSGANRLDHGRREWQKPNALHGGDTLTIAGFELPRGYHWDVVRKKGAERLTTTHEVWKFSGANSYCNIYPDGYIRAGQGDHSAKRVWP